MKSFRIPHSYPSLTPTYGLGSYGRTGPAIIIGGSRPKIGSQSRIYNYFRTPNERAAYVQFMSYLISNDRGAIKGFLSGILNAINGS